MQKKKLELTMETNGVTVKQEPEVKTEEPPTEDFQKLTEYGINIKVANEIVKIYETGECFNLIWKQIKKNSSLCNMN